MSAPNYKDSPGSSALRLPDIGASDEEVLHYRDRYFNYKGTYRCRHMERMALSLYYVMGRQWMELDSDILLDGVRGYVFREMRQSPEVEVPRPVTNYVGPSVEVELASLGRRELTPNVLTTSNDTRLEAAAKVAKEILQYRMKVLNWPEIRELSAFLTVVTGTSAIKSFWDETYSDLTTIANPGAIICPTCGTTSASSKIPKDTPEKMPVKNLESATEVPTDDPEAPQELQINACPTCDEPVPMQPHEMGPEEAESGVDFMGRPMGMQVPKGNTGMEVVSPFDLFPMNSGVGIDPETCKLWGQASVRDMDWIEERYPEMAEKLEREDPAELMRVHPLLGEHTLLGRYDSVLDSGIYDNHARVYELHGEKNYRFPQGRSIIIVGDQVLKNDVLYKTVDGVSVPGVTFAAARFKPRHGEFWGQSLVDDIVSPQNRLNGMDAQIIEARERTGSPNILAEEGMNVSGPSWNSAYGMGKIMYYSPSPMNAASKPEIFGGQLFPSEVYKEREQTILDIKAVAGPQDVEIGEAPRNISTTSGLQLLGEQAERRRAPRERALIAMYERIWSHQLRLVWALRTEMDEYETKNDEGNWETKQYDKSALAGQTKVEVEKQAFVNKSLAQSEGTREAMADGLYRADSQPAIKRILELRNLPTDVNEDLNRQVDIGKQQWVDFIDEGVIPSIDTSIDDFRIRFQVLGTFLLSDEGKRLERAMGWPHILKLIAGWEEELQMAEMMDMQAVALYGSRNIDPAAAEGIYAQATIAHQETQVAIEKTGEAVTEATGVPPPPAPMAPPPPPPIFLPAAKEDRVYMVWKRLISLNEMKIGPAVPTVEDPVDPTVSAQAQDAFLKFRAVVDAYRLLAAEREASMMMGATMGAAPGTPEGNAQQGGMAPPGGGGAPGPGGKPGMDFNHGNNPATPPKPSPAPGVPTNKK